MCYKHLDYLLKIKTEHIAILEMRSHIPWYIKGLPEHKEIQSLCFKAKTKEEAKIEVVQEETQAIINIHKTM